MYVFRSDKSTIRGLSEKSDRKRRQDFLKLYKSNTRVIIGVASKSANSGEKLLKRVALAIPVEGDKFHTWEFGSLHKHCNPGHGTIHDFVVAVLLLCILFEKAG